MACLRLNIVITSKASKHVKFCYRSLAYKKKLMIHARIDFNFGILLSLSHKRGEGENIR